MGNNIFIAGHNGMVGSAILRNLSKNKSINILVRNKKELNLTNQKQVLDFFNKNKINQVYLCAARVGGIHANNSYPANFLYENLMIQSNVINSCFENDVEKLLFLGSSCIYPRLAPQPIAEESLLTSSLEPTNEAYAIAKISGLKMCEFYTKQYSSKKKIDYRSVMPTNLYGQGDNYDLNNSHVIPALIKKIHNAKLNNTKHVKIWGDGSPLREFMHVDDLADACTFYMNLDHEKVKNHSFINIGSGNEITIKDLALLIIKIIGFKGVIKFDKSKPNGTPRKLMDSSKINDLGWHPKINLEEGIIKTYQNFLKEYE
tara:strand:+ start:1632 stop:2579 length:948 start_codon:yes stop_codon:yes gene_type:complete